MSFKDGRKRLLDAFEEIGNKSSRSVLEPQKPLHGVVICLTGLPGDKKNHLHDLVERLGGRYTRDFNLDKNTHLVAEVPHGAKYELASSHPRIRIVTPSWLEDCERTGTRVDETSHRVNSALGEGKMSSPHTKPTYRKIFDILLKEEGLALSLFEFHQFYLMGFEEASEVKQQLGKAIRRVGGTIRWNLSDDVNMLIVHDTCHEALRKAAEIISNHHPNFPPAVSPRWIIDSIRKNVLAPTSKYPPMRVRNSSVKPATVKRIKSSFVRSHSTTTSIFRGSLFALSRIAPSGGAVDFDSKQQESLIKTHGGQILTLKLLDAMRVDAKNEGQRRRCHVVCWGGAPRLDLNPILSQLQRYNICDLTLVTPVWLNTCISAQKLVPPSRLPEVLVPQPWPFRDLKGKDLRVSITGFMSTEKAALVHIMEVCGISFLNEMTSSSTHLVCKEQATGLKLERALEWGLHIVSVKWLYYVLQHGYHGENNSFTGGCEVKFSLNLADGGVEAKE